MVLHVRQKHAFAGEKSQPEPVDKHDSAAANAELHDIQDQSLGTVDVQHHISKVCATAHVCPAAAGRASTATWTAGGMLLRASIS